jgi:phenylalanyl-tRNA synthetase beta chain
MKISYNWLKELTGLDWPAREMADRLTLCGTACEYLDSTSTYLDRVVVGLVTALNPIEGATKIQLATVDLGSKKMDVVCGAPNVAVGQKVPVALEGAKLADDIVIKKTKIRGVESSAMICSERELGLSEDHSGIMVLPDETRPGDPVAESLDLSDYIMTFELTPNRPDSMSAIGIARDLAALSLGAVKRPATEVKEVPAKAADKVKISIEDPDACPRYAARVIENVKVGPSPWWIKKKLLTAGVRPISNVVDITNLVMLETGHPLHAFDLDRFGSNEVVVRKARDKEKFTTLDGEEHELTPDVLLITNGKVGVAAGGVMGGLDSEVEDATKNILLEAAYFNSSMTRKSRKLLGLVTESSVRFEKGADPNGVEFAINRAASLMQELCGGQVLSGIVDCYPKKIQPLEIELRPERCNAILGLSLTPSRMKQIFTKLEFETSGESPIRVSVPTFRPDIEREIDLIEEIGRIEGYDAVVDSTENIGRLYTPIHYLDKFRAEARTLMLGSGFDELVSHGLADSRRTKLLNPELPTLGIVNPVSEDLDIMRNTLAETMLAVISHNIAHRNLDLCLFEIGKAYFPPDANGEWVENLRLCIAVTGDTPHTWRDRPRPYDLYDISGPITTLAQHFGWGEVSYRSGKISYFDDQISFDILVGDREVGKIGKVTPEVARKFDIKQAVHIAEIDLDALIVISGKKAQYQPLPIYPAAPRDLAIVVDEKVKAGEIVGEVKQAAGSLAESVEIFDLYTGKPIEPGKKSVAIAINYRSLEGNLASEQVDEIQSIVIGNLKKRFNAQIRDK